MSSNKAIRVIKKLSKIDFKKSKLNGNNDIFLEKMLKKTKMI